jgi:hypothetical protein
VKCLIDGTLIRARLGLWVHKVRFFLDPLREKFYRKYLARHLKMDVGGGAKPWKYELYDEYDLLSLEASDGLDM